MLERFVFMQYIAACIEVGVPRFIQASISSMITKIGQCFLNSAFELLRPGEWYLQFVQFPKL